MNNTINIFKRVCIILLLCCKFLILLSQEYCGIVRDSSDHSILVSASVCLLSADSLIISYDYTNEDGYFCLSSDKGITPSFLTITHIGYKAKLMDLKHFVQGMIINIAPSVVSLREVHVDARRLYMTGDTLVYSVSGFKAPQDKSIADVLRRMPGIQVSESGAIQYQGMEINKFYIEGLDLLEDKYKLASKNLRAEYIQDVQILENHEPVNSLRGKTFSEQAAVNLILKEDAKQTWLATVDAGIGETPLMWSNRLMGMTFNRKNQQLHIYKNDNTGENISTEIISVKNILNLAEKKEFTPFEKLFLAPISYPTPPVREKRYRFNNEHLAATNHLYKLSEDSEIKVMISFLNNWEKYRNHTDWIYFTGDSTFSFNEKITQKKKQHELESRIIYMNNSERFYLTNKLSTKNSFNSNNTDGFSNHQFLTEKYGLPSHMINNEFKLVSPYNTHRIEISSITQFNSMPDEMSIDTEILLPFIKDSNQIIKQDISTQNFVTNNSFDIIWQKNKIQIGQHAGILFIHQQLKNKLTNRLIIPDYSFVNNSQYERFGLTYSPYLVYKTNNFSLKTIFNIRYDYLTTKHHLEEVSNSYKKPYYSFLPSLNIKLEPGYWSFTGKVNFDKNFNTLYEIHPSWIIRNYKYIYSSDNTIGFTNRANYNFAIGYRNPIHALFIGINAGYRKSYAKQIEQTSYISQIIIASHLIDYKHDYYSIFYALNFSKSFNFWNSRFFLNGMYNIFENNYLINNSFSVYNNHSLSASGRIYVQPIKWFNSEYEIHYGSNRLKIKKPYSDSFPGGNYYMQRLNTYFFLNKYFELGINQELFHGNNQRRTTYFIDLSLLFRKNNKELSFIAENLLNHNTYSFDTYQTYRQSKTSYQLRERCFLFKISFSI